MLNKEKICVLKFDCAAKRALVNELKYRKRSDKNRNAHIVSFSVLGNTETNKLFVTDTYPSEQFREIITSKQFDAVIHSELLCEALKKLKADTLDIILLKYWMNLTDKEIGSLLNMSQQKVNYRKNSALAKLKNIITEMMKHDEWFEL